MCRFGHTRARSLGESRLDPGARDGMKFADELGASFTVAFSPDRRPVDHDWMFEQPGLFFGT